MENNSGSSMLPFISGLVIGAALGILFAPEKGSETRKKVMSGLGNLSGGLGDMFGQSEGEYEESGSSYTGSQSSKSSGSSYQGSSHSSGNSGSTGSTRSFQ